ncbi:MAG TPA: hypothetical protein VFS10_02580 [Pyrinomonadaceae bacterium]|nr:hypothetical protein [Pyrinomonadaceae bacterium]
MLELVLLFIVVPYRCFNAARASGRNRLAWALVGMAVFFTVELLVIFGSSLIYFLLSLLFGWTESFDELFFSNFIYLAATGFGLAGAEFVRYKLMNPDVPYFDSPPPPEQFHTP